MAKRRKTPVYPMGYVPPVKASPKKKEVAGPYRDQSSVPSIRKKATKGEHRKVVKRTPSAPTSNPFEVSAPSAPTRAETAQQKGRQKRIRKALTIAPVKQGVRPTRPQAVASKRKDSGKGWKPPSALELGVERDVIQPARDKKLISEYTTGQKIAKKVAEAGMFAIPVGGEMAAAAKGVQLAVKGVQAGGLRIGGTKLAKPVKLTSPGARASAYARETQKQAVKSGSGVKRTVRKVGGAERRATRAAQRQATGTKSAAEVFQAGGAPGLVAKAGGAQGLPVVRGHEQAILENPGKVAKTTARALPGFVTVPIGMAAHVGISGGRGASTALGAAGVPGFKEYSGKEILAPVKYEGVAQLEFAKQVAKVLTSDDSEEVQKAVEEELGLLIPIVVGLGAKGGLDHMRKGDRSAAEAITAKIRKSAEKARKRLDGKGGFNQQGPGARVFETQGQRRRGAQTVDKAARGADLEKRDRTRGIGEELKPGRKRPKHATGRKRESDPDKDVEVQRPDALRWVVAHGIDLDAPLPLIQAEIKAASKRLGDHREQMGLSRRREGDEKRDSLDTEDLLDALDANPDWLHHPELKGVVAQARRQERENREVRGGNPDHSEGARWEPMAIDRGIATRHERVPVSERERFGGAKTWDEAEARVSQDLVGVRASLAQAKRELEIAKSGRAQAGRTTNRQHGRAARKQEGKPLYPSEVSRLERGEATFQAAKARVKRARQLEREILLQQKKLRGARKVAGQKADRGNRHQDTELENEMIQDVQREIERNPALTEPEWTSEIYAPVDRPAPNVAGQKMPGGIKHRSGDAVRLGSTEEGLHPYIQNSISAPARRNHAFRAIGEGLDDVQYREGEKTKFTMREVERLFNSKESHLNDDNFMVVPDQLVKRIDDQRARGKTREATDWVDAEELLVELVKTMEGQEALLARKDFRKNGRTYRIVPKGWGDEVFSAMQKPGKGGRIGRKLNKLSTGLMLYTSPAWALTQFGAEYAQAALSAPKLINPAYARKLIKEYKAMSPIDRREFENWVGVTKRDLDAGEHAALTMKGADQAYQQLDRTQLGKFLGAVPTSLRTLDQWKGGRIRVLSAMAKMDKDFNGKLNNFLHSSGGLYRLQRDLSHKLRGKSRGEIAAYISRDPKLQRQYKDYLDDVMGNWSSMTKKEQTAAQFVVFYPFMRMSLKWTFYSFPKRHPIRAAASYWLGQQNATELEALLGGDPRFFGEWANVPLHLDAGEPTSVLPLSRMAVAGNAAVEALGGSLSDPTKGPPLTGLGLSVAQPALTAGVRLTTGLNKFTGKQESNSGAGAVNEFLNLSTISRSGQRLKEELTGEKPKEGAVNLFGPTERQNALDKLFAKLRGDFASQQIRSNAFTALPVSVELQRDTVRLSRVLKTLEASGSEAHDKLREEMRGAGKTGIETDEAEQKLWDIYEKADEDLDRLFKKYKIAHKADDEEYERFEEERKYGVSRPKGGLPKLDDLGNDSEKLPSLEELGSTGGLPKLSR